MRERRLDGQRPSLRSDETSSFSDLPISQRPEATRTVIVLDASKSMAVIDSNKAQSRLCPFHRQPKRSQDEVAILAIRDTKEGL